MEERALGPGGVRRGQGARERILETAAHLFGAQGINSTGMDRLSSAAGVSKRTIYQHFGSKDELVAEHLRRRDPDVMPEVFDRPDLAPRDRLLAAFEVAPEVDGPTPLCPFVAASVEIADPDHPARVRARDYKAAVAARFTATAREAGAADPDLLGEQLALLLDGASSRTRATGVESLRTAAEVATVLIDRAVSGATGPH